MKNGTKKSGQTLGELKVLYGNRLLHWRQQKVEHERQIERCQREIANCQAKLQHLEALLRPEGVAAPVSPTPRRRKKQRRQRRSPVREAALQALRNRPGARLTTKQLLAAIREDTRKKVSRQALNVNLARLEEEQLVHKQPAPRGLKARFVYSVVPRA